MTTTAIPRVLAPVGSIRIQKAGTVSDTGETEFFVLPIGGRKPKGSKTAIRSKRHLGVGLVPSCEVEFSTTADGSAAVARFEAVNLHPNTVRAMAEGGYVRIDAGYLDHPTRPVQAIFYGRLSNPKWSGGGRLIKWSFTASAFPNEIWAIKPNADLPLGRDGKTIPISAGEGIRVIADRIGIGRANVRLPRIFDGDLSDTDLPLGGPQGAKKSQDFQNAIRLERWTTTRTAIEEIQDLLLLVCDAVRTVFGKVRNYSLLPDVNNPFILVVEDLAKFSGQFLDVDLDSANVIDFGPDVASVASPSTKADVAPAADTPDAAADSGDGGAEPSGQTISVERFGIVSIFDPKVSMGLLMRGRSLKLGIEKKYRVQAGKHTLTGSPLRWRTESSGETESNAQAVVVRGS
jgi:hypothetical protein